VYGETHSEVCYICSDISINLALFGRTIGSGAELLIWATLKRLGGKEEDGMGMTITEKIFARASGSTSVRPGDIVTIEIDLILDKESAHGLWAYRALDELGLDKIPDPSRIIMLDGSVGTVAECHEYAEKFGIPKEHIYRNKGVFHHVLLEEGWVVPGMTFIGTDSHTPMEGVVGAFATGLGSTDVGIAMATGELWFRVPETVKVELTGQFKPLVSYRDMMHYVAREYGLDFALENTVEWAGPLVKTMCMDDRISMCLLSLDIGQCLTAMVEPDDITLDFLKGRAKRPFEVVKNDPDAEFSEIIKIDVSDLEPMVACPHDQDNSMPAREVGDVKINQAIIGTCASSRYQDLKSGAEVIKGHKVHPDVTFMVVPATVEVYRQAWRDGVLDAYIEAGAIVGKPGCQLCYGTYQKAGDVTLTTSSRNHRGRLGSPDAMTYLGSAATVAASAVAGRVIDPRDL
jgi:homoaconitate hydratase family protein